MDSTGWLMDMVIHPKWSLCPMNGSNSPSLWQRNNLGCMILPNFKITFDLCLLANHQNWYLRSARHSIERWAVTSRGKGRFTVFPFLYTFVICFDPDYHDASSYCLLSPSSLYHEVWPLAMLGGFDPRHTLRCSRKFAETAQIKSSFPDLRIHSSFLVASRAILLYMSHISPS